MCKERDGAGRILKADGKYAPWVCGFLFRKCSRVSVKAMHSYRLYLQLYLNFHPFKPPFILFLPLSLAIIPTQLTHVILFLFLVKCGHYYFVYVIRAARVSL